MSAEQFVKNFVKEKANILSAYSEGNGSSVEAEVNSLNLSVEQKVVIKKILDGVVTDTLYSILMGLSGSASIGDAQIQYKINDEEGNEISSDEIEEYAWEYLQSE